MDNLESKILEVLKRGTKKLETELNMDNLESKILETLKPRQDTSYRFTKKDIQQDNPVKPPIIPTPSPQPLRQSNPYEIVKRELAQVPSEEKVKILENAFIQDKFAKLEDEQINALQSILEEARREVNITNTAYKQGKLSFWKNNSVAIALVTAALTLGTITVIAQLRSNSVYQPTPTLPQSR
jgi:hypothetical protein